MTDEEPGFGPHERELMNSLDKAVRTALMNDVNPTFIVSAFSALEDKLARDYAEVRAEEMMERLMSGEHPGDIFGELINEMESERAIVLDDSDLSSEEKNALETLGIDPESEEPMQALTVENPTQAEIEALRTLGIVE